MKGQAISLINMKGGVGKTTLTVNLAHYLAEKEKKKVLLIDFDPQANATSALMEFNEYEKHRKTKHMISEIFSDVRTFMSPIGEKKGKGATIKFEDLIVNVYDEEGCIHLMPSELELSNILERAAGSNMEERLQYILKDKRNIYDYILIDCSPTYSVLTNNALNASNYVLIPVKPDPFSARGIPLLLEKIDMHNEFKEEVNKVEVLGIVFNMVGNARYLDSIKSEILKNHKDVFMTEIRFTEDYPLAFFDNKWIFDSRAKSQFKDNFKCFVEEFCQKIEVKNSAKTK